MIDIFGPVFNSIDFTSINILPFTFSDPIDPSLSSWIQDLLGTPIYGIGGLTISGDTWFIPVINPSYIFAGICLLLIVHSIFKLVGILFHSL